MMIVMYDESSCKWTTFGDACVEIKHHSEGHLYPHYPKPTTTAITTTQATSITTAQAMTVTTHNPKFENVRRFTSGKFKQIKSHGHGSHPTPLRKPLKPLTSQTTKHTTNHFSHFLHSLHRFAKGTLVGIDRGEMQKVVYSKL